jgi:hypothetical protein
MIEYHFYEVERGAQAKGCSTQALSERTLILVTLRSSKGDSFLEWDFLLIYFLCQQQKQTAIQHPNGRAKRVLNRYSPTGETCLTKTTELKNHL